MKYINNFFYIKKNYLFIIFNLKKILKYYFSQYSYFFLYKKIFFYKKYKYIKFTFNNILNKESIIFIKKYIQILYEDNYCILINKPPGLIVHPNLKKNNNTLVNSLLYYYGKKVLNFFRFGLINRLDKDTSGLMLISKNNFIYINFIKQMKLNLILKYYFLITLNVLKFKIGKIVFLRNNFSNFVSKTNYIFIKSLKYLNKKFSLIKCLLETGKTHQIRIHFNLLKNPILFDKIYNNIYKKNNKLKFILNRQMLHCYSLIFNHPIFNINKFFKIKLYKDINYLLKFIEIEGFEPSIHK